MAAQLISSQICPFAHRAWIAMEEARGAKEGFDFELKNVSLKEKPAFFSEAYARCRGADPASDGKVPVFIEKDGEGAGTDLYLAESAVVAEYVFGKWAPHILPQRPLDRARTTLFAEQVIGKLIKAWYGILSAQEKEGQEAGAVAMTAALSAIDAAYAESGGPFFLGAEMSLADVLVYPWLGRFAVITHYRGFALPPASELPRLNAFVDAMRARDSVKASTMPDAFYIEGYVVYAHGIRKPA